MSDRAAFTRRRAPNLTGDAARWILAGVAALAALSLGAASARPVGEDPCFLAAGAEQGAGLPRAPWRARLDRDVAVYLIKHAQRACHRLEGLARGDARFAEGGSPDAGLAAVAGLLRGGILEPVYRSYPALRGQDLSDRPTTALDATPVPRQGGDRSGTPRFGLMIRPSQLARPTAVRLLRAADGAQAAFGKIAADRLKSTDLAKAEELIRVLSDVIAEIGFISSPAYAAFPDLWRAQVRRTMAETPPRTAASDASFRKAARAAGIVHVSERALSAIRCMLALSLRDGGSRDQLATIVWSKGGQARGPGDTAWKELPPGPQMGLYSRRQIPPDIIRRIGGVDIVFADDDPPRMAGKTIDFENGRLVLKEP